MARLAAIWHALVAPDPADAPDAFEVEWSLLAAALTV